MRKEKEQTGQWVLDFDSQEEGVLLLRLAGCWKNECGLPSEEEVQSRIADSPPLRSLAFDTTGLTGWDSGLLVFLAKVMKVCAAQGIALDKDGLPEGVQRLLALAFAVKEKEGARRVSARDPLLTRIGSSMIDFVHTFEEFAAFIGEFTLAFVKLSTGKVRFRLSDFATVLQECGPQALPIVSLISFLVGLILAFVGAVQLQMFGAQIFVANLVGLGMAREMGAMMAGIIMAGRTGAAFAAQLGTMQVNEEIDALTTLGISPMEFLVLPRMLALALMMPLLCLYADLLGMLGGAVVGIGMLDLSPMLYYNQTRDSIHLADIMTGVFKSCVFGVIVALAGCLRGMQCGRSSAAVGDATTSAVVTSIVAIVCADATLTVIYNQLGI